MGLLTPLHWSRISVNGDGGLISAVNIIWEVLYRWTLQSDREIRVKR